MFSFFMIRKVLSVLIYISFIVGLFFTTSCEFFSSEEDISLQETSDQLRIEQTLNAFSAETHQAYQTQNSYQSTLNAMQATNDAQSTALASTDIPIPNPTDTPVVDTATSELTQVPPTIGQNICHLIFVNNIPKIAHVTLIGPEPRTFQVQANSRFELDLQAGEYNYNIEWMNYNPANDTIEFPPGDFTWTWGKAKD